MSKIRVTIWNDSATKRPTTWYVPCILRVSTPRSAELFWNVKILK